MHDRGKKLKRPESQRAFAMWKNTFKPENVARGHDGMREGYERFLTANFPIAQEITVEKLELRGVPALRVRAKQTSSSSPTILHFHGGGYVLGSARFAGVCQSAHWRSEVRASLSTIGLRRNIYPDALDDAVDAFRGLLDQGFQRRPSFSAAADHRVAVSCCAGLDAKAAGGRFRRHYRCLPIR